MTQTNPLAGPPCRRMRALALGVCLGAAMTAAPAQAPAPAGADSRIAQVTLYPGSATVERVARVTAGTRKLTFACLPASLDVASLAVAADASVQVGELSVLNEERDAAPACAASGLDARIRALEDQKALLGAEHEALGFVTGYLKGVAGPDAAPGGARIAPDPKSIAAMADALRRTGQESLVRQQQIRRQQEDLDRALKPLLAERARAQAGRARVVSVSLTLDTPRDAELRLTYQVNGPGWAPAYRAVLDTRASTLQLERQALVAQATGEDWSGVALRLSTGAPRRGTTGPKPRPWRIDIAPPPDAVTKTMAPSAPAPAPAPAYRAAQMADAGGPVAESFDVHVFQNAFATEFAVPQRIDVPSSGQRVTLALGAHSATVQQRVRTTPLADASAWLVAELPQPEGVWPAGPLQLYRDGAFVGSDTLRTGGQGPLSLSFGRDALVVVQVAPQKDLRGSAGFTGSRTERTVARAYTVENRHRTPVALQVLEASPVAMDEQVQVAAQFDPKPAALAWNEQPGVVLWSQTLPAGQSARFTAAYAITFPKDARLQESR